MRIKIHLTGNFLNVALTIFLMQCTIIAIGQSPLFQTHLLGKAKNTPKVLSIEHDEHNQVFFGTNQGLYLYNGIDYSPIQLPDSVSNAGITSLEMDPDNRLWIGTSSGEVFKMENGNVTPFFNSIFNESGKITAIKTTSFGMIISTYGAGIYFIKNDTLSAHINSENGLGDNYCYDAIEHNGHVWVGTDAGIAQLSSTGASIANFKTKDGLPDNIVHKLIEVNDQTLAIGMYDFGVAFFNTESKKFTSAVESSLWDKGPIQSIVYTPNDNLLWVGTKSDGLVCLAFKNNQLHQRSLTEINGLTSNKINALHIDIEQNIWIGSDKGASLFTGSTFEFIRKQEGLVNQNVFDVMEDFDGRLWIANETGVQQFFYEQNGENQWNSILVNSPENPIQVVCLFEDFERNIWMGTYGQGLIRFNTKTKKLEHFTEDNGLDNPNILDIVQDAKGRLWLGTLGGGLISAALNENKVSFTRQSAEGQNQSSYIYALHIDNNQQLFYATDGYGIGVFDCIEDYSKPLEIKDLSNKTIYSIASQSDGSLWLTVADEGLKRLKDGNLTSFGIDQGIRSNTIASIHCLPDDVIVVAHDKGIDVIKTADAKAEQFNPNQNGTGFDPNLNASSVSGSSIFYGTEQGVVKFSPMQVELIELNPIVWLNGLRVNYNGVSVENGKHFNYDENHFVFDYLGIWMKKPESIVYSYMLEGFDQKWSFDTKSLIATYSSLPPGDYTFKIKARSSNGNWSDPEESSFTFSIDKPFWQEWWFYLSAIGLTLLLIVSFIRYRTQKLIADKRMLEKEVNLRTSEIREQKNIIEYKNEEILSSITYAKRIQEAILPPISFVKDQLNQVFIYYQPKDIVAGDFYWMECVGSKVIYAAADCTGHGVPGAMVSVICSNALNRAVREYGLTKPSDILDRTKILVVEQFQKSAEDVKDGMDISLCSFDTETLVLEYAGANNPLWIIRANQEIEEIKATKQAIGKTEQTTPFVNHVIQLQPGDIIYTFTDGYPDQFGGPKGKKLMYRPFKELLISISQKSVDEQHNALKEYFNQWRGELEQVDDVCVIGIKI